MSVASVMAKNGARQNDAPFTAKLGAILPVVRLRFARHTVAIYPNGKTFVAMRLGAYYVPTRANKAIPDAVDWWKDAAEVVKETYGNTQEGDCVYASAYHELGLWSKNEEGVSIVSSDSEVLAQYHEWEGRGDNGAIIEEVLQKTRDIGINIGGKRHKIDGYVGVDHTNKALHAAAIAEFGTVKYGINLPGNWTCTNCEWGRPSGGTVGGHDVPSGKYDASGITIATWGGLCTIPWEYATQNNPITEGWVPLSPNWYDKAGHSPLGFDMTKLRADLDLIKNGQVPDIGPVPPGPGPGPEPVPPPEPHPPLEITLSGTSKGWLGTSQVVLSGSAIPGGSVAIPLKDKSKNIDWWALAKIVAADVAAGKSAFQIAADIIAFLSGS